MKRRLPAFARALQAYRDGTLALKLACRISRRPFFSPPDVRLANALAETFPGEAWRTFSSAARQAWIDLHPLMAHSEIRTVVHVGAHSGELTLAMNEAFPGREFYLVEPVPPTFAALLRNTAGLQNIHCRNVAVGAEECEATIFADGFSPASSFLPYTPTALEEFPFLGGRTPHHVPMRTLDALLKDWGAPPPDLLILDVQGYEDYVLRGAAGVLSSCRAVICELSLRPLYAGSSSFDSVYQVLTGLGFHLQHLVNPVEGRSLQVLQIDGVFVREA